MAAKTSPWANTLYYGDNLDVLQRHIPDESVDLIYLDPPFKSNQSYNVLFAERDGSKSTAQLKAFEDTWTWGLEASRSYEEVVEEGGRVAEAMIAFRTLMPSSDMLAYLSMMAPRLKGLRDALKLTGALYLHCDPTASHYLKILLDAVFDPRNFRSEIIWRRTGAHGKSHRYAPLHDTILFYSRSDNFKWNFPKRPYMKGHVEEYFVKDEKGWRTNYYGNVLTGSGRRGGESGQPWQGFDPTAKNRHWAVPGVLLEDVVEDTSGLGQHEKLDLLLEQGFIKIVPGQAWPMYEHYLKPEDGQAVPDIWAFQPYTGGTVFGTSEGIDEDVRWLNPKDQERLGYPTQKPVGLLERIVRASSDEDDVVLDPFCGCGTSMAAAHKLNRRWIGIDVTQAAIVVIKERLKNYLALEEKKDYRVVGEPTTLEDARALAHDDPYQFQWWVLGKVGARPDEGKKGKDRGIDGRLYFHVAPAGKTEQVTFSVKAGKLRPEYVRELRGVVERDEAAVGVLLSFEKPTKDMRKEAADGGFYQSPSGTEKHPRVQLVTVEDLLDGKGPDLPVAERLTFKKAVRDDPTLGL